MRKGDRQLACHMGRTVVKWGEGEDVSFGVCNPREGQNALLA